MNWIPVEERLPEMDADRKHFSSKSVLVVYKYDYGGGPQFPAIGIAYFAAVLKDGASGHYCWFLASEIRVDVTHWMPLPELP